MKTHFILFVVVGVMSCAFTSPTKTKDLSNKFWAENMPDTTIFTWNREEFIKRGSDSIDNALANGVLPSLLFDQCLDYNLLYMSHAHDTSSIRVRIISNVTNVASMEWILKQKNVDLDKKCIRDKDQIMLEASNDSWRDLIERRISELKK